MALWGNTDSQALTGNVTIASGNTSLAGLTGATFNTQLRSGDFLIVAGQSFKIVSVTSANVAVVTPAANAAITNQSAVISKDPKWLSAQEAINVSFTDTAEAQDANNRINGIVTPGWTRYESYTAGPGGSVTRKKAETLVAFKGQPS